MADWDSVEAEIGRIMDESQESFTPETIANVREFLKLVRDRYPIPEVGKGYWNTICVGWGTAPHPALEIDIFGDRFEVYRIADKRTDIWDEPHVGGDTFSQAFLAEIPWLPHEA